MVFRSLIWILTLTLGALHAVDSWTPTPPAPIPGGGNASIDFTTIYDPTNGTVLATWRDASEIPSYAVWNGTSWSTPLSIPGATASVGGLQSTYDATNETVLATWLDDSNIPTYAIWNGSFWVSATSIPGSAAAFSLTTTYNPTSGTILATWSDQTSMPSKIPTYAVWGGSLWTSPTPIPGASAAGDDASLVSTYNAASGTVLAIWHDRATNKPTYAVWSGGSSWGPVDSIPSSVAGAFDITLTYDATSEAVLVTWLDGTVTPTYAAWSGGSSWVPAASIPGALPAAAASPNLTTTYNATSGTVLATWIDSTQVPTYAVWAGGTSWSSSVMNPPTFIPGASAATDFSLISTYSPARRAVLATWIDYGTDIPTYAVWGGGSSWGPVASIPGASSGGDLVSVYDAANETVLLVWGGDPMGVPTYAVWIIPSRAFQRPSNRR